MMPAHRWLTLGLLAFALMSGVGILLQHATTEALRAELAVVRDQQREYARLRVEHARLLAAQPPAAELERLRADHAALVRLRAEIDDLKSNAERVTRGADTAPRPAGARSSGMPAQAALSIGLAADGGLMVDQREGDLNVVRERLSRIARGDAVEIHLRADAKTKIDDLKTMVQAIQAVARELGLKYTLTVHTGLETRS